MGVRFQSVSTTSPNGLPPQGVLEGLVPLAPRFTPASDFATVLVWWYYVLTLGTATTALIVKARRNTDGIPLPAGVILTNATLTAVGGQTQTVNGCFADTPPPSDQVFYSVSMQQVSATGNAAFVECCMSVTSL